MIGSAAGGWVVNKVKQLADVINTEYKEYGSTNTISPDWSGNLTDFASTISQGSTVSTRVGDSVKLQRLIIRGYTAINSSATYTLVRMIIYRASGPIATGVAIADMLSNTGSAHAVISKKTHQYRFATKTLYDKTYALSTAGNKGFHFDLNLPLNYHVEYSPGTTTARTNGLYMCLISSEQTAVPSIYINYQLSFTDT